MAEREEIIRIKLDGSQFKAEIAQREKEINSTREAIKLINYEIAKNGEATKEQIESKIKLESQERILRKELTDSKRILDNYNRSTQEAVGSNNKLRAELSVLTRAYNKLSKEERESSQAGIALKNTIKGITDELKDTEGGVGDFRRNVGGYFDQLKGLFSGGGGIGGAISGISGMIPGLGMLIGPVIGGLTSGLEESAKSIIKLRGEAQQLLNVSGAELDLVTAKAQTIADIFEADYNDTLKAANALTKQFGIESTEALELIQNGFLAGANISGEFLDSIKEYSTQFEAAGGSAEEFVSILAQTSKQGIFSDKGIDAIKEGMLSLREQTKATVDALKPLGETVNKQIFAAVNDGRIFDGIKLISKGLKDTSLTAAETGAIIADVFRGAGEDAGLKFLQSINDINSGLEGQIDLTNELVLRQKESAEATEEYNLVMNTLSKTFTSTSSSSGIWVTNLKTEGARLLNGLILIFRTIGEAAQGFMKLLNGAVTLNAFDVQEGYNRIKNSVSKVRKQYEADQALLDAELGKERTANEVQSQQKFAETKLVEDAKANEKLKKQREKAQKELEKKQKEHEEALLRAMRAAIELRVLESGEGSKAELAARLASLGYEFSIALDNDKLSKSERLLLQEKYQNDSLKLVKDYTQKVLDEQEKQAKAFVERTEKEYNETVKNTENSYKQRKADAANDYANGIISRETYNARLKKLDEEFFNQQIIDAKDYGQSTVDIELEAANRRVAIRQKEKDDKQMIMEAEFNAARAIVGALMDLNSLYAGQSAEMTDFAKALTLVQLSIDTASAISNILNGSAIIAKQVAQISGPAAPILAPLAAATFYATQFGMVIKNMATARELLAGDTPQPSFYEGGYTTPGNPNKQASNLGSKTYIYHQNEYITPSYVLNDPLGAYHVNQLELLRLQKKKFGSNYIGFYNGGFADVPSSTQRYLGGASTSQIDYNKLAYAMSKQPVIAKIQEINSVNANVNYREVKVNS